MESEIPNIMVVVNQIQMDGHSAFNRYCVRDNPASKLAVKQLLDKVRILKDIYQGPKVFLLFNDTWAYNIIKWYYYTLQNMI